ncbi:hypothetical protein NQ315_001113 [Exocentrus adspersus]|uniref:U6 snRNA phosphodiesterase n=1 Tax=Exocentrus adspersus TaxID=1586481 RepID=A0AAV8WF19_9CUCU|nr:hypothetical protein NQ315_001113 [Exocentrus adspersus]
MLKKGALSLLNDYGGDSSDDDVPGPGVSVKRLHGNDEGESVIMKKVKRLPVPGTILGLHNSSVMEHVDNPSLHEGRLRSFAHERGNWATYVYVPYEENEGIKELIQFVRNYGVAHSIDIKKTEELHISLTRTLVLKHHWINLFVNTLKANLAHHRKFMVLFDGLEVYCNEERTRTFLGLQIKTGYDSLLKLVETLDRSLEEFNLPAFYEDPSFHLSIAWCVGDFEQELKLVLVQFNHQLRELMEEYSQENWYIYVENLICKTGNKYFQFYLS